MTWRGFLVVVGCLATLVFPASSAAADEGDGEETGDSSEMVPVAVPTKDPKHSTDHRNQFGMRIHGGTGLEFFVPYNTTPKVLCGRSTCFRRSGGFFDVDLTFAPASAIEIIIGGRWIVEKNRAGSRELQLRPGILIYLEGTSDFKPFMNIQGILEFSGEFNAGGALGFGFQYDFVRYVGAFIQLQANYVGIGYSRLEANLSLGVHTRIP